MAFSQVVTEVPLVVDPATTPRVGGLPSPWPKLWGIYTERWRAYQALKFQGNNPRFELVKDGEVWKLFLHQS